MFLNLFAGACAVCFGWVLSLLSWVVCLPYCCCGLCVCRTPHVFCQQPVLCRVCRFVGTGRASARTCACVYMRRMFADGCKTVLRFYKHIHILPVCMLVDSTSLLPSHPTSRFILVLRVLRPFSLPDRSWQPPRLLHLLCSRSVCNNMCPVSPCRAMVFLSLLQRATAILGTHIFPPQPQQPHSCRRPKAPVQKARQEHPSSKTQTKLLTIPCHAMRLTS